MQIELSHMRFQMIDDVWLQRTHYTSGAKAELINSKSTRKCSHSAKFNSSQNLIEVKVHWIRKSTSYCSITRECGVILKGGYSLTGLHGAYAKLFRWSREWHHLYQQKTLLWIRFKILFWVEPKKILLYDKRCHNIVNSWFWISFKIVKE